MKRQSGFRDRSAMQEKAIQKFPFNINNETYFSSECYFEDTIINGVSLELKQGKGITNNENSIDYLTHSNRLVFYAGCNIISFNSYKRKYEIISKTNNLICLKAMSLSTIQKQYVLWLQKQVCDEQQHQKLNSNNSKYIYTLYVYDINYHKKIYQEVFYFVNHDLKYGDQVQIMAFMHPYKALGFVYSDQVTSQSCIAFKKMLRPNEETEFGPEIWLNFNYEIKNLKYDLQSNSYFFIKNQFQIWSIRCYNQRQNDEDGFQLPDKNENKKMHVQKIMSVKSKKLGERKIIHFAISQLYLILLTCKENNERNFQIYSLFSYMFIFGQSIWYPDGDFTQSLKPMSRMHLEQQQQTNNKSPIDRIQFNKNIIIGIRDNSNQISIFNLSENQIKHIKDATLILTNCFNLQKLYINPFSSEVIVLSRHYEQEGAFNATQNSVKTIRKSESRYKNFFLEVSSFFITIEASKIQVEKMGLQRKNYHCILTAPWMAQFLTQTENSIRSRKWQQKFDSQIKCSALHPTGQYIALGFSDSFKIYYLTYQGLAHTCVTENVKQCISLSYSRLGHDFAVATCTNILIYNSYNYEKKFQISLGISYRIEQISYVEGWSKNKSKQCLKCVTNTKRIVIYNVLQNYSEEFAFNPKNHLQKNIFDGIMSMMDSKMRILKKPTLKQQSSLACFAPQNTLSTQNPSVFAAKKGFGAILYDQKVGIAIFSLSTKLYFISTHNFQSLGCFDFQEVSCLQLCRQLNTLFMGTVTGKIVAFPWPNKPINITSKIPIYWVHRTKIKKIKVTSNLFQLVSITQQSMYVHSLNFIHQMRKIQKYELQRQYNPKSLLAIDFIMRMGICLFTVQKYEQKGQIIKEIQQQAINVNFMLPQERQKQKMGVMNKLETQKNKVAFDTQSEMIPLKIQSINIKQKIKTTQKQIRLSFLQFEQRKQNQIQEYQKKISQFSSEKDQLRILHSSTTKKLEQQMNRIRQQLKNELIRAQTIYRMKIQEVSRQVKDVSFQSGSNAANFHQLIQMDEQKKMLSEVIIKDIQNQIGVLLQRNGYLSCRNTNLQKDIATKRRKIDDIKELIQNTQRNIKNIASKNRITLKPEQIKQQNQINRQFSQTEKRYLKQTKKLIQKNKAINVSIQLYERERQMLVMLEQELEKSERSIDELLIYIMSQREQKQKIKDKLTNIKQRAIKINQNFEVRNTQRIKVKNNLKQYLYQLTMFQQGVIDLQQLKKISQIKASDKIHTPQNVALNIEEKKKKISKIESAEQKIMNVMKNQRKIYSNQKRKSSMQNQDLLVNFNFLLHENKELINKMKDQRERKQYCIKNLSSRRDLKSKRLMTKPTPFEQYVKMKTTRRLKTTPCAQYQVSR